MKTNEELEEDVRERAKLEGVDGCAWCLQYAHLTDGTCPVCGAACDEASDHEEG